MSEADEDKDAEADNQDAKDAGMDMAVEVTVQPTAGATGLTIVPYDPLLPEGRIVGGVTAKKRTNIELRNLHTTVEQKTANIIAMLPSMDIYSLHWIEQHLKECKKLYNSDYKSKKEYVKYVKTSVRVF